MLALGFDYGLCCGLCRLLISNPLFLDSTHLCQLPLGFLVLSLFLLLLTFKLSGHLGFLALPIIFGARYMIVKHITVISRQGTMIVEAGAMIDRQSITYGMHTVLLGIQSSMIGVQSGMLDIVKSSN